MLTVVAYGRNDSYGYNLAKRAAISLNCIAEVLDDPDDEVVFVDYNTPDELPTFPEAIADTLTDKARRLLRVLRVRPGAHERLRSRTHLVALESVSRNAAVRRANPANRWVLATNTDMLFVPVGGTSLSAVCRDLPDGFYELPRFEVPEPVWESFDRSDPRGTLADVARLGRSLHLQLAVVSPSDAVFDGPGDFQLVLRRDLEALGGFDESLLAGWHVDYDLCRRVRMLRGEPNRSLLDQVHAYHCDHTLVAGDAHQADRVENDYTLIEARTEPCLAASQPGWGLAGEDLDEVRLTPAHAGRLVAALGGLAPGERGVHERLFGADALGDLRYDVDHVLPFLGGVFVNQPAGSPVGWVGCRPELLARFCALRARLGQDGPVLVDEACAAARGLPGGALPAGARAVGYDELVEAAGSFVVEVGIGGPAGQADGPPGPPGPDAAAAIQHVHARVLALVADEEARAGGGGRLFVVVNGALNELEGALQGNLSLTSAPFSAGVRIGRVVDSAPATDVSLRGLARHLRAALGRPAPLPSAEVNTYVRTVAALGAAGDAAPVLRHAVEVGAVLGYAGVGSLTGLDDIVASELRDGIEASRPSKVLRRFVTVGAPSTPRPLSRVAAIEDWDDPAWFRDVRRVGVAPGAPAPARSGAAWQVLHTVHGLRRLGVLRPGAAVCVTGTVPRSLPTLLCRAGASPDDPPARGLDAVIVGRGVAGEGGLWKLPDVLRVADALRPGGVLVVWADVSLDAGRSGRCLDAMTAESLVLEDILGHYGGLDVAGPFDAAVSDRTLDASSDDAERPAMVELTDTRVVVPSAWFATATCRPGERDWAGLGRAFAREVAVALDGAVGAGRAGRVVARGLRPGPHVLDAHLRAGAGCGEVLSVRPAGSGEPVVVHAGEVHGGAAEVVVDVAGESWSADVTAAPGVTVQAVGLRRLR